jgi:thioredoxin-like negative regulator of GroEL
LPRIDYEIARLLILQHRFDDAAVTIARIPAGPFRDQAIALNFLAPGQRAAADAAFTRLTSMPVDAEIELAVAEVYAFRGEHEAALERIASLLAQPDSGGASIQKWVREEMVLSPFLRVLHADQRWSSLLASADTR